MLAHTTTQSPRATLGPTARAAKDAVGARSAGHSSTASSA